MKEKVKRAHELPGLNNMETEESVKVYRTLDRGKSFHFYKELPKSLAEAHVRLWHWPDRPQDGRSGFLSEGEMQTLGIIPSKVWYPFSKKNRRGIHD